MSISPHPAPHAGAWVMVPRGRKRFVSPLNTHTPAALYEAFPPAEARRLVERLEIHYTPKHGSWLNMAELEFSLLARQCLDRRIGDRDTLVTEAAAWEAVRNKQGATIRWQFTVDDARRKLHRLYPV